MLLYTLLHCLEVNEKSTFYKTLENRRKWLENRQNNKKEVKVTPGKLIFFIKNNKMQNMKKLFSKRLHCNAFNIVK